MVEEILWSLSRDSSIIVEKITRFWHRDRSDRMETARFVHMRIIIIWDLSSTCDVIIAIIFSCDATAGHHETSLSFRLHTTRYMYTRLDFFFIISQRV